MNTATRPVTRLPRGVYVTMPCPPMEYLGPLITVVDSHNVEWHTLGCNCGTRMTEEELSVEVVRRWAMLDAQDPVIQGAKEGGDRL